jgi:hypothetical protein
MTTTNSSYNNNNYYYMCTSKCIDYDNIVPTLVYVSFTVPDETSTRLRRGL